MLAGNDGVSHGRGAYTRLIRTIFPSLFQVRLGRSGQVLSPGSQEQLLEWLSEVRPDLVGEGQMGSLHEDMILRVHYVFERVKDCLLNRPFQLPPEDQRAAIHSEIEVLAEWVRVRDGRPSLGRGGPSIARLTSCMPFRTTLAGMQAQVRRFIVEAAPNEETAMTLLRATPAAKLAVRDNCLTSPPGAAHESPDTR
jgi:hypothetical protein